MGVKANYLDYPESSLKFGIGLFLTPTLSVAITQYHYPKMRFLAVGVLAGGGLCQ